MQLTVKSPVVFEGTGLHSGKPARMVVRPARADHGVWFRRVDVSLGDNMLPAHWEAVNRSPLCTRLENASGVSVSTVEHIMAALAGCGIHNALIDIDGPEIPILDGSSVEFVRGILARGVQQLSKPVLALRVKKPVTVSHGDARATLEPSARFEIDFRIDFDVAAIGSQAKRLDMANGAFVRELSDSRTFCRKVDVDGMRAQGLALGGTLENAVVVDGDTVLSPGGFRHVDEPVRHKMLDALGDLALAGAPIIGRYVGTRSGHSLTNTLLRAAFADPEVFETVICDAETAATLPGAGLIRAEIPEVA